MFFNRLFSKSDSSSTIDSRIEKMQDEMRTEAKLIIEYWTKSLLDQENGGFYGKVTNDLRVHQNADKHFVQQARALWGLSISAQYSASEPLADHANKQYEFIVKNYLDPDYGGFYWSLSSDCAVNSDDKYLYAQDLGIYALSEYHALTRKNDALALANDLYQLHNSSLQGVRAEAYISKCNRDWTPDSTDDQQAMVDPGILLHTVEAYARLWRETRGEHLRKDTDRLYRFLVNNCYDEQSGMMWLLMNSDLEPMTEEFRPGHDLEFAWLCLEAIDAFESPHQVMTQSLRSIDLIKGQCNTRHGGLRTLRVGKHKNSMIYRWWDNSELIIALWYAYHITGKPEYIKHCLSLWDFLKRSFKHVKINEWNWLLNERNIGYTGYIVGPWKSLYHHIRALHQIGHSLQQEPVGTLRQLYIAGDYER